MIRPVNQRRHNHFQAGFSLLEILVALTILGISMAALMQVFAGGLKGARKARDYNTAVLLAQSKMEESLMIKTVEEGAAGGIFEGMDRFSWVSEVTPFELPADEAQPVPEDMTRQITFNAYQVTVTVSWGPADRTSHYILTTLKTFREQSEEFR